MIFFIDNIDAYDRKNIRKFKLLLNFIILMSKLIAEYEMGVLWKFIFILVRTQLRQLKYFAFLFSSSLSSWK